MFWKFRTKQRVVFRIIHARDSLLPKGKVWSFVGIHRNHDYRPSFKATTLRWDWSLPISVPGFFFPDKKLPSWTLFFLVVQIWRRKKPCEKLNMPLVSSQVGMWVKVRHQAGQQKSLDFSCSSRQTINRSALAPLFLGNGSGMMKAGTPSTKLMDISEKVLRWLGERAKGRPGMMYVFSDPKWGAVQNPRLLQNHRVFAERSSRLSRHDIIMKFIGVVVETQVTVVYWSSLFCYNKVPVLTFEEDPRAFILCTQQKLDVERHLKGSLPVGNAGLARDTLPKMQ